MGSTLVVQWSDWHLTRERMGTYERALEIPNKLWNQSLPGFDDILVIIGGDILDGIGKFPSHRAINSSSLSEQVLSGVDALEAGIMGLRSFEVPISVMLVPGNHGKLSKEDGPRDNVELLMGYWLQDRLEGVEGVSFYMPRYDGVEIVRVQDTTGIIIHRGPPHIETNAQRGKALALAYEYQADWIASGHLHHVGATTQGLWLMRNGSLMDRYERHANRLGFFESPRQQWFLVVEDSIVQVGWITWVDERRKPRA